MTQPGKKVQVIWKEGEPEYAVLPWADYRQLLQAAGQDCSGEAQSQEPAVSLSQLRHLREDRGLTLEALAREAGISPAYLELIEAGEREASPVLMRALGRVLSVRWQDPQAHA